MKPTQVQAVYGVVNEVGQMALEQPVLQGTGQELLLFRVVGNVACTLPCVKPQTSRSAIGKIPSAAQTPRKLTSATALTTYARNLFALINSNFYFSPQTFRNIALL